MSVLRDRLRPRGLLARADVRSLWLGETISELGSTVSSLAIPLVAVVTLHAGPFATSMLIAAAWLPWLLIGLPVGAWVDRLAPRKVMIAADVVSVLAFVSVPIAAWLGMLTLGQLLMCASLGGCAAVCFDTAYQVFLPSLLDGEELAAANALMHGSQSATHVGGPGLAGLLASAVGAVSGVLLNAMSFLVSAACLLSLGDGEHRPAARERAPLREEIAEGARFVAPVKSISPFNDYAKKGMNDWQTYAGPTKNFDEMVFNMVPYADAQGKTLAGVVNKAGNKGASIEFNIHQLPLLTLWKNTDTLKQGYVTGIEPGTNYAYPVTIEREQGRVKQLQPGQSTVFELTYSLLPDANAVSQFEQRVKTIQGSQKTQTSDKPMAVE